MKLHAITFAAALFAAHLATAQVEQPMVGTVTDTVSSTVILGSDMATQAQQEAALKAEKAQLKDQEKDLKAQEKAIKEKAKQEEAAKKAEEKAAKEKAKAEKQAQKKKQQLSKANSEVAKVEAKITKAKNDLAKEQNKFDMKKAKGALSPQDEAKFKGKLLKKQQKINSLGLDLIKAKERVNKYSM